MTGVRYRRKVRPGFVFSDLLAEPATRGLPPLDVIADHLNRRSNRVRQDESDSAPEASPEEQGNRDGQSIQMDAAPNDSRHQDVEANHVEKTQRRRDTQVWTYRLPLGHPDQERRQPRQYRTQIGHEIQQARDTTCEEWVVEVNRQKKRPAGEHQYQRH